jgi:tripartite-type tricarboxylate transporter receptor subunit TctC
MPAKESLPNVPDLTAFYPDAEYIPWQALFATKGTPKEAVARLNTEINKALALPEVRTRMAALDLVPAPSSPAELDRIVRADMAVNRELVKAIGLKIE